MGHRSGPPFLHEKTCPLWTQEDEAWVRARWGEDTIEWAQEMAAALLQIEQLSLHARYRVKEQPEDPASTGGTGSYAAAPDAAGGAQ